MTKSKRQLPPTEEEIFKANYMQALNEKFKLRSQLGALKNELEDLHAHNERMGYDIQDKKEAAVQIAQGIRSKTTSPIRKPAAVPKTPPQTQDARKPDQNKPTTPITSANNSTSKLVRSVPSPEDSSPVVSPRKHLANVPPPQPAAPATPPRKIVMVAQGGSPIYLDTSPLPSPVPQITQLPPTRTASAPKLPRTEPVVKPPPPVKPENVWAAPTKQRPDPEYRHGTTWLRSLPPVPEVYQEEKEQEPEVVYQDEVAVTKLETPKIPTNIPDLQDELERLKRVFANITFYAVMIVLALFSVIFAKEIYSLISRVVHVIPVTKSERSCICKEPELPVVLCQKPVEPAENICMCESNPKTRGSSAVCPDTDHPSPAVTVTLPDSSLTVSASQSQGVRDAKHVITAQGEFPERRSPVSQCLPDSKPKMQVQYKVQVEDIISMYDCDDCNKKTPKARSDTITSSY